MCGWFVQQPARTSARGTCAEEKLVWNEACRPRRVRFQLKVSAAERDCASLEHRWQAYRPGGQQQQRRGAAAPRGAARTSRADAVREARKELWQATSCRDIILLATGTLRCVFGRRRRGVQQRIKEEFVG